MRAEDIRELTRRQPFQPFRLHLTGGKIYDIQHPDQIIATRSKIVIGVEAEDGIPDHLEHIALIHIVRLEELSTAVP